MSGIHQMLLSGSSLVRVVNFNIGNVGDLTIAPVVAAASVTFNSDGTIAYSGSVSNGSANWTVPTLAGVGNNYWIKLVVSSGNPPTSGSGAGNILALSANRQWKWTTLAGGTKSADCTITVYSDPAGGVPVFSNQFFVYCESQQ